MVSRAKWALGQALTTRTRTNIIWFLLSNKALLPLHFFNSRISIHSFNSSLRHIRYKCFVSLHHNMPSQALNNQPALKKAYLQNTQQEGNMKYAYLTNWIAYLDNSISLIKFHVTESYQFFSKKPQNKTNWGSSQPPRTFYCYSSPKSVINTSSDIFVHHAPILTILTEIYFYWLTGK